MQNSRVHEVFTSVIALWETEYCSPLIFICLHGMKKYLKLKKVSFKNIDKFFISLMDKPVFDKGLVLPDKLPDKLIVSTRVSPPGLACTSLQPLFWFVLVNLHLLLLGLGALFVLFTYCFVWPIIKTLVNGACSPRGMLMPSPQGRDKITNVPPPGLTTWANAPRLPGGWGMGTAGIDWCISHKRWIYLTSN